MMRQIRKCIVSYWTWWALIAAVLAVYANAFGGHFLLDDEFLIQKNLWIRSWSHIWDLFRTSSTGGAGGVDDFYRPMQTLAYLFVYQLGGLSPIGYHALNIALHLGNALLVFALGMLLGLAEVWAFLAALLWAVHPLHTEAVTYMSATADTMYVFFCLFALWLLMRFESRWAWLLAVVSGSLALISKESAAVLPALAVILLGFKYRRLGLRPAIKRSLPFWILLAIYLALRATVLDFRDSFNLYHASNIYSDHILFRFYTFLATLPSYLGLLAYPHHLHMERSFPIFVSVFAWPVAAGALILLASLWILWRGWRRREWWWILGPAWFFTAHSSQSGVLVPVNALILEHWMYLPSIGLFWVLGHGLEESAQTPALKRGMILCALILAGIWGGITFKQNRVWQNPIVFYNHILLYETGDTRVENNLGMAYADAGDPVKAVDHYKRAITLNPHSPNAYHNLGLVYWRGGNASEAIQELEEALKVDPNFYQSMLYLSKIYAALGNTEQARKYEKLYEDMRRRFPGD